jgi:hypothetical protein
MKERNRVLRDFLIELVVYGLLVFAYFALVLHFLGGWLKGLYDTNKTTYAIAALGLMIGQGVLLEILTTALLRFVRGRTD